MKYISVDIETTGLNPDYCDVIEFGAVLDDLVSPLHSLPQFHCYVTKPMNRYQGEPYALWMNANILKRIADREAGYSYIPGELLDEVFAEWIKEQGLEEPVVIAGKNFANFDLLFLRKLGFGTHFKMRHRILDPGCMYMDFSLDNQPPSLETCLERAGMPKRVSHTAIEDALDVIRCIRYKAVTDGGKSEKTGETRI